VKVDDGVREWNLPQGRGGRIRVGPDLRVEGHPEIFAVGDVAADTDEPLPQLARPAIDGGRHAGAQVRRLLAGQSTEPFVYITSRRHTYRKAADVEIKVYSNQLTASLRLNGAELGAKPVVDHIATWQIRLAQGANRLDVTAGAASDSVEWHYQPAPALQ